MTEGVTLNWSFHELQLYWNVLVKSKHNSENGLELSSCGKLQSHLEQSRPYPQKLAINSISHISDLRQCNQPALLHKAITWQSFAMGHALHLWVTNFQQSAHPFWLNFTSTNQSSTVIYKSDKDFRMKIFKTSFATVES